MTAEELCRDHLEALEEVRTAIRNLRAAGRIVGDTHPSTSRTPGERSAGRGEDPVLPSDCRYQLIRFLAEGGLGRVYVGRDTELNRDVAIKFIQPTRLSANDAAQRFAWEAEVTGQLEHPGIAPVYGLIRDPASGQVAYAMRLLSGETLQQAGERLHAGGPPAPDSAAFRDLLAHFSRACRTVGFGHGRGFLHRDLKPTNVMISPAGETWFSTGAWPRQSRPTGVLPRAPATTRRARDRSSALRLTWPRSKRPGRSTGSGLPATSMPWVGSCTSFSPEKRRTTLPPPARFSPGL